MSHHSHHEQHHNGTVLGELICHMPYAIFSVAFALAILSFFSMFTNAYSDAKLVYSGASMLFHSFHFMHIVFAATGTVITFLRFSRSYTQALLVGIFSPIIFCMLSDAVLPYIGGRILGVPMHFHICFLHELHNILPFLLVGIVNGFAISTHGGEKQKHSLSSHAMHIFVSSLASAFYLVAHGFINWYVSIGPVFLFLIFAVVVPCTFSDVIVPMIIAKGKKLQ